MSTGPFGLENIFEIEGDGEGSCGEHTWKNVLQLSPCGFKGHPEACLLSMVSVSNTEEPLPVGMGDNAAMFVQEPHLRAILKALVEHLPAQVVADVLAEAKRLDSDIHREQHAHGGFNFSKGGEEIHLTPNGFIELRYCCCQGYDFDPEQDSIDPDSAQYLSDILAVAQVEARPLYSAFLEKRALGEKAAAEAREAERAEAREIARQVHEAWVADQRQKIRAFDHASGEEYKSGVDFIVDPFSGYLTRLPAGRIPEGAQVRLEWSE